MLYEFIVDGCRVAVKCLTFDQKVMSSIAGQCYK